METEMRQPELSPNILAEIARLHKMPIKARAKEIYRKDAKRDEEEILFRHAYASYELWELMHAKNKKQILVNGISDTGSKLQRKVMFDLKTSALLSLIGKEVDYEKKVILQDKLDPLFSRSPYLNYQSEEYKAALDRGWKEREDIAWQLEKKYLLNWWPTTSKGQQGVPFPSEVYRVCFESEWSDNYEEVWQRNKVGVQELIIELDGNSL